MFVVENWHGADHTGHVRWTPLLGDRVLEPNEFLELAGEQPLADANRHKRAATIGLSVAGSLAVIVTMFAATNGHATLAWGAGASSVAMLGGAIYEASTIRYLTAGEANELADRYNATHVLSLRRTF
jgi:hypothetical protein